MHIAPIVDRYHRAHEKVSRHTAELCQEAVKEGLSDDLLDATVSLRLRERYPEIYTEYVEAIIARDQAVMELRVREVEANERAVAWATLNKVSA